MRPPAGEHLLKAHGVVNTQDLTARARDSLVSFGERLSTRLFAALLNSQVRPCDTIPNVV